MKKLRQNIVLLVISVCLIASSFATVVQSSQPFDVKVTLSPTPKKQSNSNSNSNKKSNSNSNKSTSNSNKSTNSNKKSSSNSNKSSSNSNKSSSNSNKSSSNSNKSSSNSNKSSSNSNKSKSNSNKSNSNSNKSSSNSNKSNSNSNKSSSNSNKSNSNTIPSVKLPQVIVNTVSARIKSQPSGSSTELRRAKLGTIFGYTERKSTWYKVQFTSGNKTASGWMPSSAVDDYSSDSSDEISAEIINRYYAAEGMSFTVASELYSFLSGAKNTNADLGLKRLLSLRQALKALSQPQTKEQKDFLKNTESAIVYSEPSDAWYVRSELFWDLHKKFKNEDIAWEAAKNPLSGECEGYVNCYLFYAKQTDGEYLNQYPNGKNSLEALVNITNLLEPIVQDLTEKAVYVGPTDVSDRAEFNQLIADLRSVISRLGYAEKEKTIQQLEQIAEGFR